MTARVESSTVLLLIACMMAWVSLMGGFLAVAPIIDERFFPPLTRVQAINVVRQPRLVCWDTTMYKARSAVMTDARFWIVYPNGSRDEVRATLGGKMFPPVETIPVNTNVILRSFCVTLPLENGHISVDISEGQSTMNAQLTYNTNRLWSIKELMPNFTIPKLPVHQYGPGDGDQAKAPCVQCHGK